MTLPEAAHGGQSDGEVLATLRRIASMRPAFLGIGMSLAIAARSQEAPASETELESITVTAQSRTESERDVPIALQVVTPQQIQDLAAVKLSDLDGYVPGLMVYGTDPTQPGFFLRGVGANDFGIGTDAPVGVYVDGVYAGKTGGALINFNDVQRIEVLKGPQGTLFGRNSAAGAISIVSNEPDRETDAAAALRYGSYETVAFNGYFNVPLSSTVALRVSAESINSRGWVTDQTTGQRFGGNADWGTRASVKWTPGTDAKLVASWEHEALDQVASSAFSLVRAAPGTVPPFPPSPAQFINPLDAPLQNDAADPRESRTFDSVTVRGEAKWGGLGVSSLSAYRHFRSLNRQSEDGTADPLVYLEFANNEQHSSLQQDVKLSWRNDAIDWIAGASLYHDNGGQVATVDTNTESLDTATNNLRGAPLFPTLNAAAGLAVGTGLGNPWEERLVNRAKTTSYSLYGDAIWHLTAETNLTTGARLTEDRKSMSWYVPAYLAPALDASYVALTGMTFSQFTQSVLGAPITNIVFSSQAAFAARQVSASKSWGDFSPRLVLDHKLSKDAMLYASLAKGFQSGGFDSQKPFAGFRPERMLNEEIGFKLTAPRAHAYVEGSLFHYSFTNLQSLTLSPSSSGLPIYLVSTSDQHAVGMDLSGTVEPMRDLGFFGGAEVIRQQYGRYAVPTDVGIGTIELDGQPVGTPLLSLTLGMRALWRIGTGRGELVLQGAGQGPVRCNAQLREEFGCLSTATVQTGAAQERVDLRVGWSSEGNRFGAAVIVNNVLDQRYLAIGANGGPAAFNLGAPFVTITPPREISLELRARL